MLCLAGVLAKRLVAQGLAIPPELIGVPSSATPSTVRCSCHLYVLPVLLRPILHPSFTSYLFCRPQRSTPQPHSTSDCLCYSFTYSGSTVFSPISFPIQFPSSCLMTVALWPGFELLRMLERSQTTGYSFHREVDCHTFTQCLSRKPDLTLPCKVFNVSIRSRHNGATTIFIIGSGARCS